MSAHNIHIRQLILNEFHAGQNPEEARININAQIGNNRPVSASRIRYWYNKFKAGQFCISNRQTTLLVHPNLLFESTDQRLRTSVISLDERYMLFQNYRKFENGKTMTILDLFHGLTKQIPVECDFQNGDFLTRIEAVDNAHFLGLSSVGFIATVYLFHINYDEWKIVMKARKIVNNTYRADILTNDEDRTHFLMYMLNQDRLIMIGQEHQEAEFEYATLSPNKDEILLQQRRQMNVDQLDCYRLMGKLMCGFLHIQDDGVLFADSTYYCEMDISELKKTSVKLNFGALKRDFLSSLNYNCYCWFEDNLYVPKKMQNKTWKVFTFNRITKKFCASDIVVPNKITELVIDDNGYLVVRTEHLDKARKAVIRFYRYALKTPDTLKNLAWLAIMRNSKLMGADLYKKMMKTLPKNLNLSSRLSKN